MQISFIPYNHCTNEDRFPTLDLSQALMQYA